MLQTAGKKAGEGAGEIGKPSEWKGSSGWGNHYYGSLREKKPRSDALPTLWTHALQVRFCFAVPRTTVQGEQTAETWCLKEEHSENWYRRDPALRFAGERVQREERSERKGSKAGRGGGARTEGAEAWRSAFIMHASYMAIQWQGCEHCEFFLAVNSTVPLTRSYEFGNLSILFFRRHSRLSSCFE